jgi:hypothetical protein
MSGNETVLATVDRLIDRASDEVHRIEISDPDQLEESDWFKNARSIRRAFVKLASSSPPKSTAQGIHSKVMVVKDAEDLAIADKVAHTPLTIIVEDREADGVLLEILIKKLANPELARYWTLAMAATPPAIQIDTAGGINAMPQRVNRAIADAALQERPVRFFCICDSDNRWPNDPGNQSTRVIRQLQSICAQAGIPIHVLIKRNAENYIPDDVYLAARNKPENIAHLNRFDALLRRSAQQRDHFPIKEGLKISERTQATAAGLYASDEHNDLQLLEDRLFPKRPRLLLQVFENYINMISPQGLLARDGCDEVIGLLDRITAEL